MTPSENPHHRNSFTLAGAIALSAFIAGLVAIGWSA